MNYPAYIEEPMDFPDFYRVSMHYPSTRIECVEDHVRAELDRVLPQSGIGEKDRVAVAVGSRGISNIPVIVKTLCDRLKEKGALPHIIPAMGSHGGAHGPGQKAVLESLGVTEAFCGAPIVSSMDVEKIHDILDGVPVYYSKDCISMDHAICINRIKPHTKFKGPVESGIYKMLCIGMGKHSGALSLHQAALSHGFNSVIRAAGDAVIQKSNVRFALALVENQYDQLTDIRAISSANVFDEEKELLIKAKDQFPTLPFRQLDVLVIGEIGKNISGSGMDPNVTGRAFDLMEDDFSKNLKVTRIALLDLCEKSAGNAIGMGNADFITERLYGKLDYEKTLINALTSLSLRKAFIPIRLKNDRCAIQAAMKTTGIKNSEELKVVIIKNTREVSRFWASPALLGEINAMEHAEIVGKVKLDFTSSGDLILF
ncbi:MAG: hypothetical protein KKD44_07070 [Proteobacteria bacterium]|nr:hypothetical protein [Pseudomonadota bacterium]